jgi:hypothetical protein
MAKITVTKSNTTILPDYSGSRASICIYYDHALKSVVMLACGESILLSKDQVKTVRDVMTTHYKGM